MESSLPNPGGIIRTFGYVLRSNELPGHLSNDDEPYFPSTSSPRVAVSINGRYSHPHQTERWRNRRTTQKTTRNPHPPSPRYLRKARPLPQTRKMRILKDRDYLSWSYHWKQSNQNGSCKITRRCRLDYPTKPY